MRLALLPGLLLGCDDLHSQDVADPASAPVCHPGPNIMVPKACRANIVEHGVSDDCVFTEFNDRGLQLPSEIWRNAAFRSTRP